MASNLFNLPQELQDMIMTYITSASDLKSLSLVSRAFSAIATPVLYHDLVLKEKVEGKNEAKGSGRKWLSRVTESVLTSRGLEFVRTLSIDITGLMLFDSLLHSLPDDSLIRIECRRLHGYKATSFVQFASLCKHQKNLRCIRFDSYQLCFSKETWEDVKLPKIVTELQFHGKVDIKDIYWLQDTFELGRTKKLTLDLTRDGLDRTTLNTLLSDHLSLRQITHLNLHCRMSGDRPGELHWDNLPALTHLCLAIRYNHLSSSLASWNQPALRELHIQHGDCLPYEDTFLDELSQLLQRFKGLDSFLLHTSEMPKTTTCHLLACGIEMHKDTLNRLILHQWGLNAPRTKSRSDKHKFTDARFLDAARECKKLSQLALPFDPHTFVLDCRDLICTLPNLLVLSIEVKRAEAVELTTYMNTTRHSHIESMLLDLVRSANSVFSDLRMVFCGSKAKNDSCLMLRRRPSQGNPSGGRQVMAATAEFTEVGYDQLVKCHMVPGDGLGEMLVGTYWKPQSHYPPLF